MTSSTSLTQLYIKVLQCVIVSVNVLCTVDLLVKVGELVDKLFDLDEELMKSWIITQLREADDSESHLDVAASLLEAAKQLR